MEFILYFILGSIVSVINWLFIVSIDTKKHVNVYISLFLGTILWPAVLYGWICRFVHFISTYNLTYN